MEEDSARSEVNALIVASDCWLWSKFEMKVAEVKLNNNFKKAFAANPGLENKES